MSRVSLRVVLSSVGQPKFQYYYELYTLTDYEKLVCSGRTLGITSVLISTTQYTIQYNVQEGLL